MKKITVLLFAITLALVPSCKNQENKNAEENNAALELNTKEQIASELVKADVENIIASAQKIKPAPFASGSRDGKITLTAKEKKVKPDYLINPNMGSDMVTFSQKYRYVSMLAADLVIANLYEMPANEYKNAISTLLVELGDDAFTIFAQTPWIDLEGAQDAMKALVEDEYAAGREVYYWESVAASLVEQVYIITRNVDKFMPMFTDETATDFTFNFICLHESLLTLVDLNPEMADLNEILAPLYVINAISVDQLREQLVSLQEEIVTVREKLLK